MEGSSVNHGRSLDSSRFGLRCHWGMLLVDEFSCARLGAHYVYWLRNRCRRAINRLAKAQVTTRRWVFFASPR